ncbi:MAG TPA: class I SAM-dependent methyltransferase [Dongiaceae bacterium]|nr:class I SAM-dependent methyltransferase [Dongiaceae bacterium]
MLSWLRYRMAALGLKSFSATQTTRRLYRWLGNSFGQRRHSGVSAVDLSRGLWLCDQVKQSELCLDKSSAVLELGTGWTHFYAVFLRLFFETRITLFDVQDNRQLNALKRRFADLESKLALVRPDDGQSIHRLVRQIREVRSFTELYASLGLVYVLEPNGSLAAMRDRSFDMVFSMDVLEHVQRASVPGVISGMYRVLKPGGLCLHQIGLDDHLSHYAAGMPSKNYLRYSDGIWKAMFENEIQYFNRLQLPEFEEAFAASGFQLLSRQTEDDPRSLSRIVPHAQYLRFDASALAATRALLTYRKPLAATS